MSQSRRPSPFHRGEPDDLQRHRPVRHPARPGEPLPFDPPAAVMALHREAPLRRLKYYPDGTLGWLVTSHRLGRQVLADQRFKSRFTAPVQVPVPMPGLEEFRRLRG